MHPLQGLPDAPHLSQHCVPHAKELACLQRRAVVTTTLRSFPPTPTQRGNGAVPTHPHPKALRPLAQHYSLFIILLQQMALRSSLRSLSPSLWLLYGNVALYAACYMAQALLHIQKCAYNTINWPPDMHLLARF